jgi:hypothetical protein
MKVTIKEWNAVATWHWNIPEDEVCGICRVQFDGTCPTCKFPGDDCALGELNLYTPTSMLNTDYDYYSARKMQSRFSYGKWSGPSKLGQN